MIPQSELIIKNNKIYHLDLAPEELATKIILVGDPNRAIKISELFDKILIKRHHREFLTITGLINNEKISVVGTGIGVSNIEIVINEIDALFNIDFNSREPKTKHTKLSFLRLGTSGTLQPDINPGTLVFASETIGFDSIAKFYDYTPEKKEWHYYFDKFVKENFNKFPEYYFAESKGNWILPENVIKGITLTAPSFYAAQGRNIKRYSLKYENFPHKLANFNYKNLKILNIEMEASLINFLGNMLNHNTATLCTILANRYNKTFISDYEEAINNLINTGIKILLNSA